MITNEYKPGREKTCLRGPKDLYYLCSEDKGADQLRNYRASRVMYRVRSPPVFFVASIAIFGEKRDMLRI